MKDLDFPVLLFKQVFINKDQSTGTGFPVSNDFTLSADQFASLYKKRWSVEEYHKSIKQNASIGSSPVRSVKAQSNHLFASIFAFVKLEKIKLAKNLNHFTIKAKLYTAALKVTFSELNALKEKFNCCVTSDMRFLPLLINKVLSLQIYFAPMQKCMPCVT